MSLGKTAIANLALVDIGAKTITDFDPSDGSNESDKVTAVWDSVRDEVLAAHNWDFAKFVEALALDEAFDIPDEAWDYAYDLPALCLKARYLSSKTSTYEIRGLHLLCDVEDAILIYTKSITDTTAWDTLFVRAFVKRLSAALARPLKRRGSTATSLLEDYEAILQTARMGDATQTNKTQEDAYRHTADSEPWITARNI